MKNRILALVMTLFMGISSLSAQTYDDVYDSGSSNNKNTVQPVAPTSSDQNYKSDEESYSDQSYSNLQSKRYEDDDEYIDFDDDDYYFATRIRRFHNSFWRFGYYSSFFMDPFWWDMSCSYPSFSIGWGYPSWYYGNSFGWNNNGWNNNGWNNNGWNNWGYGYNMNPWGCYSGFNNWGCGFNQNPWGFGNNWGYGFGNNYGWGYNNGYNNGYWNGYWDGFYGNNGVYGGNKSAYVYGPRSSANSGVRYNRASIRNADELNPLSKQGQNPVRSSEIQSNSPLRNRPVDGQENIIRMNTSSSDIKTNQNQTGRSIDRPRTNLNNKDQEINNHQQTNVPDRSSQNEPQMQNQSDRTYRNNLERERTNRQNRDQIENRKQEERDIRDQQAETQQREERANRERIENQRREQMNQERERMHQQRERANQEREYKRNKNIDRREPQEQRSSPEPRYEAPRREQRAEPARNQSPRMQESGSMNNGGGRRR